MNFWQTAVTFVVFFIAILVCVLKADYVGRQKRSKKAKGDNTLEFLAREEEPSPTASEHTGKCDGDCANCPPHYGYRYGRWYYGHDHSEGCEFGGNKCGGGM